MCVLLRLQLQLCADSFLSTMSSLLQIHNGDYNTTICRPVLILVLYFNFRFKFANTLFLHCKNMYLLLRNECKDVNKTKHVAYVKLSIYLLYTSKWIDVKQMYVLHNQRTYAFGEG